MHRIDTDSDKGTERERRRMKGWSLSKKLSIHHHHWPVNGSSTWQMKDLMASLFTYSNGHVSVFRAFQISSRNILLRFLFRIDNISVHRIIRNFTLISNMVTTFRRIGESKLIVIVVAVFFVELKTNISWSDAQMIHHYNSNLLRWSMVHGANKHCILVEARMSQIQLEWTSRLNVCSS